MPLLDDITIGSYQPQDSFIHNLDPRTKGFITILFMAGTFGIHSILGLLLGICSTTIFIALAKSSVRDLLGNLKAFAWLFIFTFALHLFFSPPGDTYTLPVIGWRVSISGLENGFFYSMRILLVLTFSYLFMAVTSPLEISDGLEKVMRPLLKIGFPVNEAAMMLSIAFRFVPVLLDEARRIKDAQVCRGARLDGNIYEKVRGFSSMLIPLFISALRRADNLSLAIEARGYSGGRGKTCYIDLRFRIADLLALIIAAGVVVGFVIL